MSDIDTSMNYRSAAAFRRMDALAAQGADSPEYRAAFADFQRLVDDARDATRTVTSPKVDAKSEAEVVLGGRYVVGEDPTFRFGETSVPCPDAVAGMIVTSVRSDNLGDWMVKTPDGRAAWVNPRHLTPAPDEPAETPAGAAADMHEGDGRLRQGRKVGQHLCRGETPVGTMLTTDEAERLVQVERERDEALRQRDEARATKDLHKERQQELQAALNAAERERDEARAELDRSITLPGGMELPEIDPTSVWLDMGQVHVEETGMHYANAQEAAGHAASALAALAAFRAEERAATPVDPRVGIVREWLEEPGLAMSVADDDVAELLARLDAAGGAA